MILRRLWREIVRRYRLNQRYLAKELMRLYLFLGGGEPAAGALDATLDILLRDSDSALKKFRTISDRLAGAVGDDLQYIREYSNFYICIMEKRVNCEAVRQKAIRLNPDPQLRRTLVIADYVLTDDEVIAG